MIKTSLAVLAAGAGLLLAGCSSAHGNNASPGGASTPPKAHNANTFMADLAATHTFPKSQTPVNLPHNFTSMLRVDAGFICQDYRRHVVSDGHPAGDMTRSAMQTWTWQQTVAMETVSRVDLCPDVLSAAQLRRLTASLDTKG